MLAFFISRLYDLKYRFRYSVFDFIPQNLSIYPPNGSEQRAGHIPRLFLSALLRRIKTPG